MKYILKKQCGFLSKGFTPAGVIFEGGLVKVVNFNNEGILGQDVSYYSVEEFYEIYEEII